VKRSGRDEPVWVVIHMCMEAMLEISLYSHLYLKLAKTLGLSYDLLCFLLTKLKNKRAEQVLLGSGGRKWPKQCIHMLVNVKAKYYKKGSYM
jgi:hypothetical protein